MNLPKNIATEDKAEEAETDYIDMNSILLCGCTKCAHGEFYAHADDMLGGMGCPVCTGDLYQYKADFGGGMANVAVATMDRWAMEAIEAEGSA